MKLDASADVDWAHHEDPRGRVVGGKYLQQLVDEDKLGGEGSDRQLIKVETDMPLTWTDAVMKDNKEWVVLEYAPGDPENPFNWSLGLKWLITTLLNLMTIMIGLATTAYNSGMTRMCKDLHASKELGQLGLFTFNMTCAVAPLFLAPFCELVGRRIVYTGAYVCFSICFIGLALGKNIATIICMRAVLGLFGCVGTILVGGTFDDMFIPQERAIPMAFFSWSAIFGTVAAPIYAGFVDQAIGWRWVEGIQGLANIPLLILVALCLRETRGGVFLQRRAKKLREDTGDERWLAKEELEMPGLKEMLHNSCVKSFHMLLTEPVVFFFGLWIAFAWFITFLFLSVIGITFGDKKQWGEGVAGLPYISLCIGATLAFGANFLQIAKYNRVQRELEKQNLKPPPETRLYGCMFGSVFLPIGLFIYSFTQYKFVHWIGPNIGLACITFGIFFIFESCYSFTSDCYGPSASSAIAAQGFMRNTLGAVSPLFGYQFFHNVGSQYAGLILSCVAAILTVLPFALFKYGPWIRARSKRAIVYDGVDEKKKPNSKYGKQIRAREDEDEELEEKYPLHHDNANGGNQFYGGNSSEVSSQSQEKKYDEITPVGPETTTTTHPVSADHPADSHPTHDH